MTTIKDLEREKIEQATKEYLANGGKITKLLPYQATLDSIKQKEKAK